MKQIVVVDTNEIMQAVVAMLNRRPSLHGRFIAALHIISDPEEQRKELRVRINAVTFDTEKKALEYQQSGPHPEDLPRESDIQPSEEVKT